MIERAYTLTAQAGLAVWCEDEAGPFQAIPHPGGSWRPKGRPATQPHEYVRGGTIKILTLLHPATGQVRVQPTARCTNMVLHGWLKATLDEIVAALPVVAAEPVDPAATHTAWQVWQEGLALRFTLPEQLPPLRMLLVWDNLAGHKTSEMVLWLCRHGIMPLYTPLGGSWLNMAEVVFTQMTKAHPLAAGAERDDVADVDLAVADQHPIDQQLDELPLLREVGAGQAGPNPPAEVRG